MRYPKIKTVLPGPKALRFINEDNAFISPSYTRTYPLVVDKAKGVWVQDVDGNEFLDFTAGIAVCSTGHCHPEVVQAIKEQSENLLHMAGTDFYYVPQISLAKKLSSLFPEGTNHKVYFGCTGAEAVEAAFKLARQHTKRELNIAFFWFFSWPYNGGTFPYGKQNYTKKTLQSPCARYYPYPLWILLSLSLRS